MAISCFYTEIVINQFARDDENIYQALNKHAGFWNVHRYCLQSTFFITLSRVFDVSGDVRSIHTLLSTAIKHPELFSKDALRTRKIAIVHGTPDWLEAFINEAWEPTVPDLRELRKSLKSFMATFQALYAPVRNQVFAHSIVTDQQLINELFERLRIAEIDQLLYGLRDLLSNLSDLFYNGHKPALGKNTYSYKDRITETFDGYSSISA